MYYYGACSHILNIYSKLKKPPTDKGNLYLSGIDVLDSTKLLKANHINCVLTIIDKSTYDYYSVEQKIKNAQIKYHKWIDLKDG